MCVKEPQDIIVEVKFVLFVPDDRLQSFTSNEWVIDIFHEVLDGLLKIVDIKLSANHHLYHRYLTDPLIKFSVICTLGVRFLTPLENKFHPAMHWRIEITLQSQIVRVRAVIVLDAKLLDFFDIRVEYIFA